MRGRPILRGLLVIVAMAAIGYSLKQWDLFSRLNAGWIDAEVRGHGFRGELLFLGLGALATSIGVPRQVVSFLGGYAFGFVAGTGLGVVATLLGCILTFMFSRLAGRAIVGSLFSGRIQRIDRFLAGHPFSMTVMIRFLPVGNNMVTSLVAGVSTVPAFPFFVGSLIGYVPQTAIFALIGSGINVDSILRIVIGTAGFLVSALLGLRLLGRYREFVEEPADDRPSDLVGGAEAGTAKQHH